MITFAKAFIIVYQSLSHRAKTLGVCQDISYICNRQSPLVEFRQIKEKVLRVLGEVMEFHQCIAEPISLICYRSMYIKQKMELVRKVGVLGLSDVRKLAPIGDLGYANGWYPQSYFPQMGTFMRGGLERLIYEAAREQGFVFEMISHRETGSDTVYYNKELDMTYHVDSSD